MNVENILKKNWAENLCTGIISLGAMFLFQAIRMISYEGAKDSWIFVAISMVLIIGGSILSKFLQGKK